MCNKMFKNYSKFIQDFMDADQLLKVISNTTATAAYRIITDNPDPNANGWHYIVDTGSDLSVNASHCFGTRPSSEH